MKARLLIGIPMTIATIGLLVADHHFASAWGIWALYVLGITLGMKEFVRLQQSGGAKLSIVPMCGVTMLLCLAHVMELWKRVPLGPAGASLPETLLVLVMVASMCVEVIRGEPERFRSLSIQFLGFFYIWVLGSYSMKIRALPAIGEGAFAWYIIVGKWTDAAAYFTGRAIGRHKLIPKVSPGKTIEGAIGGLVFGCAGGLIVWYLTPLRTELPLQVFIPLSLVCQVAGQFGDLVESLMKRSVQAKDSSHMLPGLGGVLDVIDCLLLSAPVTYYGLLLAIRYKDHF
ncbi:MAG: phosphatidate cytidylyltransferase [Planctomycetes bacterium]|nr:phosphatidate cytidylyltransferase [Planctomycetota bacterium]